MSRTRAGTDWARHRASAGGQGWAQSPKRKYPLRKVVGGDEFVDELECGHTLNRGRDMIGYRSPTRRRCRDCYQITENDIPPVAERSEATKKG